MMGDALMILRDHLGALVLAGAEDQILASAMNKAGLTNETIDMARLPHLVQLLSDLVGRIGGPMYARSFIDRVKSDYQQIGIIIEFG